MKAIQYSSYGSPEVLELVDLPNPEPIVGEVLIAVSAISVGPGDCKTRSGALHQHHPLSFPKIPGRSGTGTIVKKGAGDIPLDVGTRVYFSTGHHETGCCSELLVQPWSAVIPISDTLSDLEWAALAHPAACAWLGLVRDASIRPGMQVFIQGGSGSIGSLAIQLAKHAGADVTATASSRNTDYLRSLGADHVIAYDLEDPFEVRDAGFDVVFDLVGGISHCKSATLLKSGGVLVYLLAEPIPEPVPRTDITVLQVKVDYGREVMETVFRLAAHGVLTPRLGAILPLEQCAEAHRLIESGAAGPGRILLTP